MRSHFNLELAQEIADAQKKHRQVITGSANLDLSRPIAWRIGDQAQQALDTQDPEHLFLPLRASASIPGAFSPVIIDDQLHVDGAVFGQFHVIGDIRLTDHLLNRWQAIAPDAPLPKVRYWLIVNNLMRDQPETIQPNWASIMGRANEATYKHLVTEPMNLIATNILLIREKYNLDIDLKWVTIPQEFKFSEVSNEFDPEYTVPLADLGNTLVPIHEAGKASKTLALGNLIGNSQTIIQAIGPKMPQKQHRLLNKPLHDRPLSNDLDVRLRPCAKKLVSHWPQPSAGCGKHPAAPDRFQLDGLDCPDCRRRYFFHQRPFDAGGGINAGADALATACQRTGTLVSRFTIFVLGPRRGLAAARI